MMYIGEREGDGGRSRAMAKSHRICTYNILSSHLAEPTRWIYNKPEHLDAGNRIEKIKMKIQTEMTKDAIICLQEVGTRIAGGRGVRSV